MKQVILLLILYLTILISCKKDASIQPVPIVGTWKWIYTYKDLPQSPTNPLTPQNTGIQETLLFKNDHTWKKIENGLTTDSGTYSLGHGTYLPYVGANAFIYDSIQYYHNDIAIHGGVDYYVVLKDTLSFRPYSSGHFSSYTVHDSGSKWWVKQ